ncbi:hypothetical protein ABE937_15440, partial [Enterococcus casseliflavus]
LNSVYPIMDLRGNFATEPDISTTSSTTEVGNFFAVKGQVKIPANKQKAIRYGLTGDVSFVVGKKSYWDQIIDFLFSKN